MGPRVLSWSFAVAQTALPPGAVSLINEDRYGSRVALCAETGEPAVQQGPEKSAARRSGSARAPNLRRIHAGLGACDPVLVARWPPSGRHGCRGSVGVSRQRRRRRAARRIAVADRDRLSSTTVRFRARAGRPTAARRACRDQRRHVVGRSVRSRQRQAFLHVSARERHLQLDRRARAEARRRRNPPAETMTSSTVRHAYLDWVRGLAVLIMIEAHVLDAWTHAADRSRPCSATR